MLTEESERIREIVRFDVRHGGNTAVVAQLAHLESYCSWAISNESRDVETYIMEHVCERQSNTIKASSARSSGRRMRQELTSALAHGHNHVLARRSVHEDSGIAARRATTKILMSLGLAEATTIPLSAALYGRQRIYETSAANEERLAALLGWAIDVGIKLGDGFASEVLDISSRWLSALKPRPGTVLQTAMDVAASETRFVAADLLRMTGANKSNVYRAIDELEGIGAVVEVTGRKKDQIWLAPELVMATQRVIRRREKR